jgi:hypothetical protein
VSTNSNNSPAMQRGKKPANRMSLAPNRRFQKLRLSFQPIGINMVSTGSKDGGVGLPTFALLSAEIQIRSAAESAMSLLCLRISNFPPKESRQGVTKISSTWNEINSIMHTSKIQQRLLRENGSDLPSTDYQKFIRYFAYQKRVIFAFVEIPRWKENDYKKTLPSLILTTRDSSGRFSWSGSLEYKENSSDPASKIEPEKIDPFQQSLVPQHEDPIPSAPELIQLSSFNEMNIPTIQELCASAFHLDMEQEIEALSYQSEIELSHRRVDSELQTDAIPFPAVDAFNPSFVPKSFRMLLTAMGFLDLKTSSDIVPLINSEQLQTDLEKLDKIQEYYIFM